MEGRKISPDESWNQKINPHTVNIFGAVNDLIRFRIDSGGHILLLDIHHRGKSTLREDIDKHGDSKRVVEDLVFGIDVGQPGNRVFFNNGDKLRFDQTHHFLEQFAVNFS